ncbi:MAG: hypothetical protein IKH38_02315 [Clostridia bacterium]|nr:hypothetical protein [Clostridia bacterium]
MRKKILRTGSALLAVMLCWMVLFCVPAAADQPETLNYSDGSVYEGETLPGGIRNGTGSYRWSTGESYSGQWKNDVITGKGEMTWPGLGTYVGDFKDGLRHGQGVFTWSYAKKAEQGQPVSFSGQWADDKIGAKGTLVLQGIGTYEGAFAKQKREGRGTFTWLNGDKYTGEWKSDAINGTGKLTLADGTVLEGTFANGVLNKGTVTYDVPGGEATRDVQGGKVKPDVTIKYQNGTTLVGKLNKNEFSGNVTIRYSNGDKYEGTLKNGKKDGKGTYIWRSGAHYVGAWSNDKMNGTGTYYYSKDETKLYLKGTFKNGSPNGTLVYVGDNKLRYTSVWSNGKCTSITYK